MANLKQTTQGPPIWRDSRKVWGMTTGIGGEFSRRVIVGLVEYFSIPAVSEREPSSGKETETRRCCIYHIGRRHHPCTRWEWGH